MSETAEWGANKQSTREEVSSPAVPSRPCLAASNRGRWQPAGTMYPQHGTWQQHQQHQQVVDRLSARSDNTQHKTQATTSLMHLLFLQSFGFSFHFFLSSLVCFLPPSLPSFLTGRPPCRPRQPAAAPCAPARSRSLASTPPRRGPSLRGQRMIEGERKRSKHGAPLFRSLTEASTYTSEACAALRQIVTGHL